jgi:hypothetical protein
MKHENRCNKGPLSLARATRRAKVTLSRRPVSAPARRGEGQRTLLLLADALIETEQCGTRKPKLCNTLECAPRTSRQKARTETTCQRSRGISSDKDPEGGSAVTAGDYPTKPPPPSGLGIPLGLTRHRDESTARLGQPAAAA